MRIAVLLLVCVLLTFAGHKGAEAEYVGGTRADIPSESAGDIQVSDQIYFIFVSKQTRVQIPYERINLIEYGQKVDRRYLEAVVISPLFMLSKKRQHFLTVGFQDDDGHQQALVFKVSKNDIRLTLVALEARTGQTVRFQDEEARIAGKG